MITETSKNREKFTAIDTRCVECLKDDFWASDDCQCIRCKFYFPSDISCRMRVPGDPKAHSPRPKIIPPRPSDEEVDIRTIKMIQEAIDEEYLMPEDEVLEDTASKIE